MQGAAIVNLTRETVLSQALETARNPWQQLMGLMGRTDLPRGSGFLLRGTRGVHTHFMRFPIDVVFYDRNHVVLDVVHALRPWRFSRYHLNAKGAIELPAGVAQESGTRKGDQLAISEAAAAMAKPTRTRSSFLTLARARTYSIPLILLYLVAWLHGLIGGVLPLTAGKEPIGGDYIAFHTAGQMLLSGEGSLLYDQQRVRAVQDATLGGQIPEFYDPFRNPPFYALLFAPFAVLELAPSFALWTAFSLGALGLAVWLALRTIPGLRRQWRAVAVIVLASPPVFFGIVGGQNSNVSLLLYTLIFCSLFAGRERSAGVWAGLGVFKPQLFLVFPIIFLAGRRWRALGAYCATVTGLAMLSLAAVGVDGVLGWLQIVVGYEGENSLKQAYRMHSLKSFLGFLLPEYAALTFGLSAALSVGLVVALARAWSPPEAWSSRLQERWAFTSAVAVLVNPHLVDYDLTVLVLTALVLGSALASARWWLLAFSVVLVVREVVFVAAGPQVTIPVLLAFTWWMWRRLSRPIGTLAPRAAGDALRPGTAIGAAAA